MPNNKQPSWLLICAGFLLFPLQTTHSTPIQTGRGRAEPCAHQSIAELIKTSPVILKALGARIFTDDDLNGIQQILSDGSGEQQQQQQQQQLHNNWQHEQNNFLTSAATLEPTSRATWHSGSSKSVRSAADDIAMMASTTMESILITLTPETIYKGTSLLKMTPGAESPARNSGSGSYSSSSSGSSSGNTAESAYQYEGQLNATLQPLACFDANVLKILPTELIAFGKLVTVQQPLQERVGSPQNAPVQQQTEVLRISINGLHRWSPQFENHIWKHLGWDGWSDFTLCSVTCGKGVQQRFRRCLLDNPMVNLNMNMNLNAVDCNGNDDVTGNDSVADDVDDDVDAEKAEIANELKNDKYSGSRSSGSSDSVKGDETTANVQYSGVKEASLLRKSKSKDELAEKADVATSDVTIADDIVVIGVDEPHSHSQQQWTKTTSNNNDDDVNGSGNARDGADEEVIRVFEGDFNGSREKLQKSNANIKHKQRGKRRKTTKSFSTMFCEGYNIEQRNCNSFECSDDISDLLKFYKRILTPEDITNIASPASATIDFDQLTTAAAAVTPMTVDVASETTTAAVGTGALPSPTPLNMGYVRSWRNALNFTLMLTLRVKNDSKTTATIFSIRNATHNLYLEPCKDGLRLYLERDSTTEMLAVKFNLYDYRWHQVAISIQNGDFISIYVDCSWTNSFVVSKRLFSLPLDADVEIGRGFNGELQQLLVLPDNQERHQCSNKRTSINEVKRYIIDTFIDDYSN